MEKYLYIFGTLTFTMYGQLVVKARALVHGPTSTNGKLGYLFAMYTDLAVLSALAAAVLASILWALALERVNLSFAYPFMALSFVLTPLAASFLFGENVSWLQLAGIGLVVAGVAINAMAG